MTLKKKGGFMKEGMFRAALAVTLVLTSAVVPPEKAAAAPSSFDIFTDSDQELWISSDWDTPADGSVLAVQSGVRFAGTQALQVTENGYGGFSFDRHDASWNYFDVNFPDYSHLVFAFNPGATPLSSFNRLMVGGADTFETALTDFAPNLQANTWQEIWIPLWRINTTRVPFHRISFFHNAASTNFNYYLDNVRLVNDGSVAPPPPSPPPPPSAGALVNFTVNTGQNRTPISPYIYGDNWYASTADTDPLRLPNAPFQRRGGNRQTGFNWENNASNAGTDYGPFSSDDHEGGGNVAGEATRSFIQENFDRGATPLITVPIVDYVAADKNGLVTQAQAAPSARWKRNLPRKGAALSLTPNAGDGFVYQDEFVNFVETTFAPERAQGKQIFYSLDNEPGLWFDTHPLIHPAHASYAEMAARTVDFGSVIKDRAPSAVVFGGVCYGYYEYTTLQDAPDQNGREYLDFILDQWFLADQAQNRRLVDVLDLHWYAENAGSDDAIQSVQEIDGRLQAPRSLWDPTYDEGSWISQDRGGPIQLIPWLKGKIAAHYPGTKLAITEYNYGGGNHVSGGIAQADFLGVMGREGVFAANLWRLNDEQGPDSFIYGGFDMYLNYDGAGHKVGDTSTLAQTANVAGASIYSIVNNGDDSKVWLVLINKNPGPSVADVQITHPVNLGSASLYQLTSASRRPQPAGVLPVSGNRLLYAMPGYSATTVLLTAGASTGASIPTDPTGLAGSPVSSSQVHLDWTDNADNEAGFQVDRSADGGATFALAGVVAADVSSFDDYGLSANTTYRYRVAAFNSAGGSAPSNVAAVTTNPPASVTLPAPGILPVGVLSSAKLQVSWTDNSGAELGFRIERSVGGGAFTEIGVVGAGGTFYTDVGLAASTTYTYRVRAYNLDGNSAFSGTASGGTSPLGGGGAAPAAPSGLTAAAPAYNAINLVWTDNSNDETGFRVERSMNGGAAFALLTTLAAGTTTYADGSVAASTRYDYRVSAAGMSGVFSAASNTAFATTPAAPVPAAPTGLTAAAPAYNAINLVWTDNSNNETGFRIERSTDSGASFTTLATTAAGTTTYANTPLPPSTRYDYRVSAALGSSVFSAASNTAFATTPPAPAPAAPSNLRALASAPDRVTLAWNDVAADETGYSLERSVGGGTFTVILSTAPGVIGFIDQGLLPETQYGYRVRAVNSGTFSGYSNTLSVTTPAGPQSQGNGGADPDLEKPMRLMSPGVRDGVNDSVTFSDVREVLVFNVEGRAVFRSSSSGGAVKWSGRDEDGVDCPSGLYMARLKRADGSTRYEKILLAK